MNKVVYNSCYGGFGLSDEAVTWLETHGCPLNEVEGYCCDALPRHSPILVQCVEELGEKASGEYADLKIEEIEGNVYRIDEYNGRETIITPDDDLNWITI